MRILYWTAIAAFLCGSSLPALAGPPGVVDDPGTAEYRHYEININYGSNQVIGNESQNARIEANYGYWANLQLTASVGMASARSTGSSRQTGFGDVGLEAKWRF